MIDTCTTNEEQISREQGVACVERRSIQYVDNMSGSVSRGVTCREANTTKCQLGSVRHLAALHTHTRHHQYIIIQNARSICPGYASECQINSVRQTIMSMSIYIAHHL